MFKLSIVAPYQSSFTIKTDCFRLVDSLKLKHGKYIKNKKNADFFITAIKKAGLYEISFDDERLTTDIPLRKIEDIMYANRQYSKDIFAIHGGAIGFNGGAYLFIAATTTGKTTLTAFLSSKGFNYITDDCILMDRRNYEIHPFTTPIHLRSGGFEILKNLSCLPDKLHFLDDPSIKRYVYTPANCAKQPLPLKKIFFITRTETFNQSQSMSTTEKVTALLHSPITHYTLDREYLSFITRLSQIPCEKLYYSDMRYVYEVIKNG